MNTQNYSNDGNVITIKFKNSPPTRKAPVKDYLTNYSLALELVRDLTKYYHSRGHDKVKVWLEPEPLPNNRKMWNLRSNISFSVPTID